MSRRTGSYSARASASWCLYAFIGTAAAAGVILASGVNGDGRTNGITAPSAQSQAELLTRVHREAGITPADIGYVEAHGTGTELGDPIETKALRQALGGGPGTWVLGSVKANIGHTTMAAGIASLVKTLLALRYGQVPPLPGFTALNGKIENADGRFVFPTVLSDWPGGPDRPRVATVSSFGFSGTNCHLVVAQAPQRPAPARSPAPVVVPVSARDRAALDELLTALAEALTPDHDLSDVAYTLSACRTHFPVRAAVVAHDIAELRGKLRAYREPGGEPADPLDALAAEYVRGQDPDEKSDPGSVLEISGRGQRGECLTDRDMRYAQIGRYRARRQLCPRL